MFITWQTLITAAAVIAALTAILSHYNKALRWVDKQSAQDEQIAEIREAAEKSVSDLRQETEDRFVAYNKEQTLLTYGILACLKGLKEQGCNGPVTEAINKIEKHLNEQAHKNI